jgi:hypothetical protein
LTQQVDYVFAFANHDKKARKLLWKQYFGVFPTFEQFEAAFDCCTKNSYECMVGNLRSNSRGTIEDTIFHYKVDLPNFDNPNDRYVMDMSRFKILESMFEQ